ncbi:hypothetical protein DBB29_22970 [Pandoraea cepalis]|uniref:tRNA nuclease CdiA-2 n=1 Tax=Pandoraea cepalis TaxID=2508294 RepID=A0AAW7MTM0_9BURK|nr:hypothetical protein [Pandoraea cepalis]MDN4580973.1 hypothetical protein [Pandoraea cepalis]
MTGAGAMMVGAGVTITGAGATTMGAGATRVGAGRMYDSGGPTTCQLPGSNAAHPETIRASGRLRMRAMRR